MQAANDHEFYARRSRYHIENFDTLEPGALTMRVKGLWPAIGVCFIGGPSMSGKSFWALDACAKVCQGRMVLGRKSKQAGVVYIAAEGELGVRNRITALRQRVGKLGGRFKYLGQRPDLTDPEDVADLRVILTEAKADLEKMGDPLGLVVVDTLSASIPGADENGAADMSPVLAALQDMAAELQTCVLVVAHTGKSEAQGLRGWSGQLANADGVIMLTEPDGDLRSGTVLKVKDGKSGDRFGFALEVVELGTDEDGDPITTCVIEERDAPEASKAGRRPTKAVGTGVLILTAFGRVLADKPRTIHAPGAEGVRGVSLDDLRSLSYEIGVGPADAEIPADADEAERRRLTRKWHDQRKADFKRGLDYLLTSQKLRAERGCVWEFGAKAVDE